MGRQGKEQWNNNLVTPRKIEKLMKTFSDPRHDTGMKKSLVTPYCAKKNS